MKKTTRKHNKGFTLVELVVVIAIIAILGAVSVVGYFAFINKAKVSNDQSLVTQLNTTLQADEVINGKAKTPSEAVQVLDDNGFVLEKLNPTREGYYFAWNQDTNRFALLDDNKNLNFGELSSNSYHNWMFVNSLENNNVKEGYSAYLNAGFVGTDTLNVTHGLDVGVNTNVKEIVYTNNTAIAKDATFVTNGGKLVLNGKAGEEGDNITHYGSATVVDVNSVGMHSYHEFGKTSTINLVKGNVEIKAEAIVMDIVIPNGTIASEVSVKPEANAKVESIVTEIQEIKDEVKAKLPDVKTPTAVDAPDYETLLRLLKTDHPEYINLTGDIIYHETSTQNKTLNICHTVTINGNNHAIIGHGYRNNGTNPTLLINQDLGLGKGDAIGVVLKNMTVKGDKNPRGDRLVETRGQVKSLTIDNVNIISTADKGSPNNPQGLTIGGSDANLIDVTIRNSNIECMKSGYAYLSFNPANLLIENSTFKAWAALNFKGIDGSKGSKGTKTVVRNSTFICDNYNNGVSDWFGTFVFEDGGINLDVYDTVISSLQKGNQQQTVVLLSSWAKKDVEITRGPVHVTFNGNMDVASGVEQLHDVDHIWYDTDKNSSKSTFKISGGTYSTDPTDFVENGFKVISETTRYKVVKE